MARVGLLKFWNQIEPEVKYEFQENRYKGDRPNRNRSQPYG
jgi:hypothetical protein